MIFKIILKQINQIISRPLKHVQKKWTQHTNLSRFYEGRSFKKETKNRSNLGLNESAFIAFPAHPLTTIPRSNLTLRKIKKKVSAEMTAKKLGLL